MYKEELSIIAQAILNEIEGYEFYKLASTQAYSSNSKEALLELANEELKHASYLKKLWKNLSNGNEVNIQDIIDSGIEIPSPNIFQWGKIDKSNISVSMSVFGIGMQMEQRSIEFYENAKNKLTSNTSKELFDLLISWEKVHLKQFADQYNQSKEDWWAEQGFAPF